MDEAADYTNPYDSRCGGHMTISATKDFALHDG